MGIIVFIVDSWGTKFGGVNAFNYDMCIALSEYLGNLHKVICIVPQASADEMNEAGRYDIDLLVVPESDPYDSVKFIKNKYNKDISWWIGHDSITGAKALKCTKICNDLYNTSKNAVVHHMSYLSYYNYKALDGIKTDQKYKEQVNILSQTDLIFAIGPKLAKSARDILKSSDKNTTVIEIIPGLAKIQPVELPEQFSAITFGRMDDKNDIIKQGKLAVAAFGKAIGRFPDMFDRDPILRVFGISDEDIKKDQSSIFDIAQSYGKRLINVIATPYQENRENLFNVLRMQSGCMMLSLHDGFGLSGFEAISAEVPLIVSKNCGLYEFIEEKLGGAGIGCIFPVDIKGQLGNNSFTEDDIEMVVSQLYKLKLNTSKAKKNSKILKSLLHEYTWENAAEVFAKGLALLVYDNIKKEELINVFENQKSAYKVKTKEADCEKEEIIQAGTIIKNTKIKGDLVVGIKNVTNGGDININQGGSKKW